MKEDWIECTLGDIAKIYNGNSINKRVKEEKYRNVDSGLNYIGTKDVQVDGKISYDTGVTIPFNEEKFKIAPKNSVLVCSEGGSAGKKTAFVEKEICFGNKLYAITNENNCFEGKYIFFYTRFNKFFDLFRNQMNGIIGGVSQRKFNKIIIPLPPLIEQKAIVKKIEELFSSLDSGIADLKKAQDQLVIYRQAVLKKAFEGEQIINAKRDKLKNITSKIGSGSTPKGGQANYKESGIPLVRSLNIHFDYIKFEGLAFIDENQADKLKNVIIQEGDVLLNITGASIGRVNIAPKEFVNGRVNQHVSIIRPKENIFSTKFLKLYLQSSKIQNWIANINVGATRQGLTKSALENLEIPLPTLQEQYQIVQAIESRLSVCDTVEKDLADSLEKAQALRQSILKKAFEGKLLSEEEIAACKAHPDYEPASVLLEKIKAQKKLKK